MEGSKPALHLPFSFLFPSSTLCVSVRCFEFLSYLLHEHASYFMYGCFWELSRLRGWIRRAKSVTVVSESLRCVWLSMTPRTTAARLPCASLSSKVCSNSCPSSRWCHSTISSSVAPFSSCLQSFPASGAFPMSRLFTSGGQSIGASASVLPMNIQDWFPLGLTGLISLLSKGPQESSSQLRSHQGMNLWPWSSNRRELREAGLFLSEVLVTKSGRTQWPGCPLPTEADSLLCLLRGEPGCPLPTEADTLLRLLRGGRSRSRSVPVSPVRSLSQVAGQEKGIEFFLKRSCCSIRDEKSVPKWC